MLLVDSNIFIYARGHHEYSEDCIAVIEAVADHPEWVVPNLVLLELTHYYRDNGEYARQILSAFNVAETLLNDLRWAIERSRAHASFNDHVILATAHRLGAVGVLSYDVFFEAQNHVPEIGRILPEMVAQEV